MTSTAQRREVSSGSGGETLDNALRGVLAEYLVGLALGGPERDARVEWDAYDLTGPDGVKIEVKSARHGAVGLLRGVDCPGQ